MVANPSQMEACNVPKHPNMSMMYHLLLSDRNSPGSVRGWCSSCVTWLILNVNNHPEVLQLSFHNDADSRFFQPSSLKELLFENEGYTHVMMMVIKQACDTEVMIQRAVDQALDSGDVKSHDKSHCYRKTGIFLRSCTIFTGVSFHGRFVYFGYFWARAGFSADIDLSIPANPSWCF